MMWRQRGRCGDDGDDGDNMLRPQTMETTWGPSGGYGDNMRMTGMMGMMRMIGTMWGWCGDYGDDMGTMGMMRGRRRPRGDNKITKNAITFEQIEIIEFCLKIWDPWALPHTCRLQLMCRWGGVLSQMAFLSKKCSGDPRKNFFSCFCTGSH